MSDNHLWLYSVADIKMSGPVVKASGTGLNSGFAGKNF